MSCKSRSCCLPCRRLRRRIARLNSTLVLRRVQPARALLENLTRSVIDKVVSQVLNAHILGNISLLFVPVTQLLVLLKNRLQLSIEELRLTVPLLTELRVLGFGPVVVDHFLSSEVAAIGVVCDHSHAVGWHILTRYALATLGAL